MIWLEVLGNPGWNKGFSPVFFNSIIVISGWLFGSLEFLQYHNFNRHHHHNPSHRSPFPSCCGGRPELTSVFGEADLGAGDAGNTAMRTTTTRFAACLTHLDSAKRAEP